MKPSTNRNRLSIVLSSLPLALALLILTPTPTLALGDWIGVEASYWNQSQDGNASIDGSFFSGTKVDFQDTLDLEETDTLPTGRVWFRFSKTRITLDYFDSSRSGDTTLTQSFVFDDKIYAAGQNLKTDFDLKLMQGQFLFSVVDVKVVDVGLGFGLNQAKISMDLDGSITGQANLDESIPYPTVAAYVTVKPLPGFHIKAELNGMRATVSGTHAEVFDGRVQIEWYVAHVLGFFAGYRQLRFDVEDEDFGTVESTFKGPYAGLGLKF